MLTVSKQYTFDAAHSLPGHPKCNPLHGHTWTLEVEICCGPLRSLEKWLVDHNGMLMDFHTLNEIVRKILENYDHSSLNRQVSMPTCENLIIQLCKEIDHQLPDDLRVYSLRLQEGAGGWCTLRP